MAHSLDSKERTKDVLIEDNISFNTLLLPQNIFSGLEYYGYKKPSPIQLKAIPVGRCGFDLIVKSKSGTGKTVVFSVIALESVDINKNSPQALILGPTREIAVQIQEVLQNLGKFVEGLKVQSFIGGTPLEADVEKCKNCHIAVGAPGRIKHLIVNGHLKTEAIRLFVLDEADKLMESSYENDINEIYNSLPDKKQMITASATYPNELDVFLSNYMLSPTHITAELDSPLLLGLKQFIKSIKPSKTVALQMKLKNEILLSLLSNISFTQCLIFSNYQTRAESISNFLNQNGWVSTFISGAQSQAARLEAMASLKAFKCRIMLSTDLTARGIDAANVDLVINYDIPNDAMTYLHRMGRAGRYGSTGVCVSMTFEDNEMKTLKNILGTIGGTNLSVPLLPDLEGKEINLLNLDTNTLQVVYGTIPEENTNCNVDIKCKVLDLKTENYTNKKNSRKSKAVDKESTEIISTEPTDFNNIMSILNESNKNEVIDEQFSSVDTKTLLESLAKGNMKVDQPKSSETDQTKDILKQLAAGEDYKKRKISEVEKSLCDKDNQKDKCKPNENIFYKNRALLSVSKVLFDYKNNPQSDDIVSVEKYLNLLKDEDKSDKTNILNKAGSKSAIDILKNINSVSDSQKPSQNSKTLENIFQIGYNYAITPNAKHWLDILPESEIRKLENLHLSENQDEDQDEESDDCEMQEENTSSNEFPKTVKDLAKNPDYAFLKWVPVKKSEKSSPSKEYVLYHNAEYQQTELLAPSQDVYNNSDYHYSPNYYSECLDECSNNLWQNGPNFDNVEDFNEWFHNNWQAQVSSVRQYIQQNIYVEEMSKYQMSRHYY